jgi:hypothetical protein
MAANKTAPSPRFMNDFEACFAAAFSKKTPSMAGSAATLGTF